MAPASPKARKTTPSRAESRAQLVVKIGDGEVRFEAGLGAVERRFDGVMDRLFGAWEPGGQQARRATSPAVAMRLVAREARGAVKPAARVGDNYPALSLDAGEVAESFSVNAADELSLRVMPRGLKTRERNADALLLLLYGMLALQGKSPVTAPALLRSARQSGLDLDRASRLLARRGRYLFTEGRRRGKRYGLTAAGVQYCEDLLARLRAGAAAARAAAARPPQGRR